MKFTKRAVVAFILLSLILAACQPAVQTPQQTATAQVTEPIAIEPTATVAVPAVEDSMGWWNEVVFYEIFVRSLRTVTGTESGISRALSASLTT